jgi:hypothetical protein
MVGRVFRGLRGIVSGIHELAEEGGLQPEILVELDDETWSNIYGDLVPPAEDPQIQAAVQALLGNS